MFFWRDTRYDRVSLLFKTDAIAKLERSHDGESNFMMSFDWSGCPLVEVIPDKVSGVPLLKSTRLPIAAITGNYDAFLNQGLPPDEALAETLDCYPQAGLDTIKALLDYRATHELQA